MKTAIIFFLCSISFLLFSQTDLNRNLIGHWTFDDPDNLMMATIGNDLVLEGSHVASEGPETGDGAVNIGVGSYYRCFHDIAANGGSANWVNEFTIVIDVKVPQLNQWYCFYQTSYNNSNDGDWFINPSGSVGVGEQDIPMKQY